MLWLSGIFAIIAVFSLNVAKRGVSLVPRCILAPESAMELFLVATSCVGLMILAQKSLRMFYKTYFYYLLHD